MHRVTMDDVVRRLPDPSQLLHLSQSLALLDAILCEQDEYRHYRFDLRWGKGEQLASMSNGSGDEYSIVFSEAWRSFAASITSPTFRRE